MKRGFYTIMAAQFFSSLADNALLIAAMALLLENHSPEWVVPLLKLFFTISYVMLAPFVGAFADSMPKGRVMLVTNFVKIGGCALLFWTVHPLLSYAVVGFGAAAYSPAKYGILTELLPPEKLVAANGWIEGTTVASIILGTLLGGALITPRISGYLLALDLPLIDTGITSPAEAAIAATAGIYLLAAAINLKIPDTGARYPHQQRHPLRLMREFVHCNRTLWRDKLGQISLSVTTLFWGAGATLQFIVLKWAQIHLGMRLDQAAILQGIVAVGVAGGAMGAAAIIPLRRSPRVLPCGVLMGLLLPVMTVVSSLPFAFAMLVVIGALAGFFVVPMNALLQHRGYVLMSAGHSIAVQNFNENLNILVMLSLYAVLLRLDLHINTIVVLFGLFVATAMMMVIRLHRANQRNYDSESLIGEHPHARAGEVKP
ncbi:MAG: lysophospholipid transporter LplT [Burkholderiaceae bacterium]|nr:lysophospholipid transporter LplT [Burkholderiaceae bacterium]